MVFVRDNRDLLDRFRRGERDALEQVYDHYAPVLAIKLRPGVRYWSQSDVHQVRHADIRLELDDILQQTFLQAFEEGARLSYSGLHPYLNYLLTISRNVVLQSLRNREIPADETELAAEPASREGGLARFHDPAWSLEMRELSALVDSFRARLKGACQEIFELRFVDKIPRTRCVKILGLSEMQLRYREKRLLKRFAKHLRKNGYLS